MGEGLPLVKSRTECHLESIATHLEIVDSHIYDRGIVSNRPCLSHINRDSRHPRSLPTLLPVDQNHDVAAPATGVMTFSASGESGATSAVSSQPRTPNMA